MSLRKTAVAGARWLGLAQVASAAAQLAQLVVLSRILGPVDFGLVATGLVIVSFLQLFADLGVSSGIVHRQDVTDEQLSSLVLMSFGVGGGLAGAMYLAAAPLAAWFGEPRLTSVLEWLSSVLLLAAVGGVFRAVNLKHLRFRGLALVDSGAAVAGASTGIAAALLGWGAHSLVAAAIVQSLVTTVLNVKIVGARPMRWRTPRLGAIGHFLRFGSYQMGEKVLNYFHSQFDIFFIGRLLGVEALGTYSVARNICARPLEMLNPVFFNVAFPTLARFQHDRPLLRATYLHGLEALCTANFVIYTTLFIVAEPLVMLMLGATWLPTVPIVRILAFYFLLRSIGNPVGILLLASGRVELGFRWNLAMFAFIPAAIWAGSHGGLPGIAWTLTALMAAILTPMWFFLVRPCCGAGFMEYHGRIIKPLGIAVVAAAIGAWAGDAHWPALYQIAVSAGISALAYAALTRALNRQAFDALRELLWR